MTTPTSLIASIPELERIEDFIAEGLFNARRGELHLRELPFDLSQAGVRAAKIVRTACEDRRLLDEATRDALSHLETELSRMRVSEELQDFHFDIVTRLGHALRLSHHASDLLAAEAEVGRIRGIGL